MCDAGYWLQGSAMRRVIILNQNLNSNAEDLLVANPGLYKRISADELRRMFDGPNRSRSDEAFANAQRDALILAALADGKDVLLADSTIDRGAEHDLRRLVQGLANVEVEPPSKPTQALADEDDGADVGHRVSRKSRRARERGNRPRPQKYQPDPKLPPAVICDLDGTLALIRGRSPYDASRCERDELNHVVAGILSSLVEPRPAVLLVSGREVRYREQTERWLAKHEIAYDELHMRTTGDNRKDTIVKQEIFEAEVRPRYRVQFVLDDRNQVVEMWRSLGLTCLQVAEGDF
jgi:hypothetical protein